MPRTSQPIPLAEERVGRGLWRTDLLEKLRDELRGVLLHHHVQWLALPVSKRANEAHRVEVRLLRLLFVA